MKDDDLIYVPGEWICYECGFRYHARILHAKNGNVSSDKKDFLEPCPNDGSKMVKLTYKRDAEDANRVALQLMKQNQHLIDKLDSLGIM